MSVGATEAVVVMQPGRVTSEISANIVTQSLRMLHLFEGLGLGGGVRLCLAGVDQLLIRLKPERLAEYRQQGVQNAERRSNHDTDALTAAVAAAVSGFRPSATDSTRMVAAPATVAYSAFLAFLMLSASAFRMRRA